MANIFTARRFLFFSVALAMSSSVFAASNSAGAVIEEVTAAVAAYSVSQSNASGAVASLSEISYQGAFCVLDNGSSFGRGLFWPVGGIYSRHIDWSWDDFFLSDASGMTFADGAYLDGASNGLVITEDKLGSNGVINWDLPVPYGAQDSLSIYFTFAVTHSAAYGSDGFVFILSQKPHEQGNSGGWLSYGPEPDRSVAIEFDNYCNTPEMHGPDFDDPLNAHIGVDLGGSLVSKQTSEIDGAFEDGVWQVWIEYSTGDYKVKVWMAPEGESRPEDPRLSYQVNLRAYFGGSSKVYLSFSGATGALSQRQEILSFYADNKEIPWEVNGADCWLYYQ